MRCDGGSNDGGACDSDARLSRRAGRARASRSAGRSPARPVGEAECLAGPVDRTCAGAPEISCTNDGGCPSGKGPCAAHNRRCFLDPIVRQGVAGTTDNSLVATFCVAETGSSTINTVAGLPGPGSIAIPERPSTRGSAATASSTASRRSATVPTTTTVPARVSRTVSVSARAATTRSSSASSATAPPTRRVPVQCEPPSSENACTLPAGLRRRLHRRRRAVRSRRRRRHAAGRRRPLSRASATHDCQCPVQVPTCLNNVLDPGEVCEVPATGCGPLQVCAACLACLPPPDILPPISGICGDLNITPGEVCELPAQGCPAGNLCNQCTSCVAGDPVLRQPQHRARRGVRAAGDGLRPAAALLALPGSASTCRSRSAATATSSPARACELPQIGCGLLQGCLACQACCRDPAGGGACEHDSHASPPSCGDVN